MCGTGNNGGDGFVVARHLAAAGCQVRVVGVGDANRLTSDAASMLCAWQGIGGDVEWITAEDSLHTLRSALERASCVVDALFGTGLSKPLGGVQAQAVEAVNQRHVPCCALDIPSGLDCDTGAILGCAIRADLTTTFAYPKPGHFSTHASRCVGELAVVSLGVPDDSWRRVGKFADRFEPFDLPALVPARAPWLYKGQAGRIAIVAGSPGTIGAALLAARGALRAGAGLVTHVGLPATIDSIESRVLEAMTRRLQVESLDRSVEDFSARYDAIVLGPGLGLTADAERLTRTILQTARVPVVIDADAITLVSRTSEWLDSELGPRVLTPHVDELARLLGTSHDVIDSDRFKSVKQAVDRFNAVVLLKGPFTIVGAPDQNPVVVGSPNPILATGGTGDVLAGIFGANLVALPAQQAALAAAALHAEAARLWATSKGADRGLLAHELADAVPAVIADLTTGCSPLSE